MSRHNCLSNAYVYDTVWHQFVQCLYKMYLGVGFVQMQSKGIKYHTMDGASRPHPHLPPPQRMRSIGPGHSLHHFRVLEGLADNPQPPDGQGDQFAKVSRHQRKEK